MSESAVPGMKAARVKRGLTQFEVAVELGLSSQVVVARWESGSRHPSSDTIRRVAEILGVQPEDLIVPNEAA